MRKRNVRRNGKSALAFLLAALLWAEGTLGSAYAAPETVSENTAVTVPEEDGRVPVDGENPAPEETEQPTKGEAPAPEETEQPTEGEAPAPEETEKPVEGENPAPEEAEQPTEGDRKSVV